MVDLFLTIKGIYRTGQVDKDNEVGSEMDYIVRDNYFCYNVFKKEIFHKFDRKNEKQ